jgi:hypothetical protein
MKDVQKSLRKNHDLHPYLIDAIFFKKEDISETHGKRTQTKPKKISHGKKKLMLNISVHISIN